MVVNSVHWFRKGLRLHDNPALQEALNGADAVRCVYILDPFFAGAANVGINRWRFVTSYCDSLGLLKANLTQCEIQEEHLLGHYLHDPLLLGLRSTSFS